MISLIGSWFDGKTSKQIPAKLKIFDNNAYCIIREADGVNVLGGSTFDARISPRLANTPRYLTFTDSGKFETSDNPAVDDLAKRYNNSFGAYFIHSLESNIRYIIISLILLIILGFGAVKYGVPAAATIIASKLPPSIFRYAEDQTLAILDKTFFEPSELDPLVEKRLYDHFQPVLSQFKELDLKIRFKKGGETIGANAFALPHGTIIFTDEMVMLAKDDMELITVLYHEIGHISERHGVRSIIQDSLFAFLLLAITGDATGTSELFLGLPVVLTELAYSRKFEREADQFALDHLQSNDIPSYHFSNLLLRIRDEKPDESDSSSDRWVDYLSTHPNTAERIERFGQEGL
ncbi:MAG: M48 family metallopeptidase [Desulfobacteraceae bacterium]|nr:M48 family metallopeptidase [Desulfobacteraceae bacterium]